MVIDVPSTTVATRKAITAPVFALIPDEGFFWRTQTTKPAIVIVMTTALTKNVIYFGLTGFAQRQR
jgi:hypothetical protein